MGAFVCESLLEHFFQSLYRSAKIIKCQDLFFLPDSTNPLGEDQTIITRVIPHPYLLRNPPLVRIKASHVCIEVYDIF